MKTTLFLSVFAGLALMACLDNSITPEYEGAKGTARFTLPEVPEAALAKTGTSSVPPAYSFSVTVSGPGMNPRTQTWDAAVFGGKTVTLEDIPSGTDRMFTGRLLYGANITHEGSTTVYIGGGQTVFVPLVLRDVRSGRAEICVEVEGWPTPKCTPIDTVPVDPLTLAGCWHLEGFDEGIYLSGTLSILARAGTLQGTFLAPNGLAYYANPRFVNGAWRINFLPIKLDPRAGGDKVDENVKEVEIPLTTTSDLKLPDTLIPPPDYDLYRTFQLRFDDLQPGAQAGQIPFLSGVMMDQSFETVRGQFKGYTANCGRVLIVYTEHMTLGDTAWADDRPAIVQP